MDQRGREWGQGEIRWSGYFESSMLSNTCFHEVTYVLNTYICAIW